MKRTGFWLRALATGIDLALLGAFAVAVGLILQPDASVDGEARHDAARMAYIGGVVVAAFWLLLTLLEVLFAATPGKMILRISIANANGTEPLTPTLWLRWFAKNLPAVLITTAALTGNHGFEVLAGMSNFVVATGCLMALGEMKLTWHDQWAGTAVFPTRQVLEPPPGPQVIRGVAPPT